MRFAVALLLCCAGWAAGDPVRGKEQFKTCLGCHSVDSDERKMGPSLRSLFGKVMLHNGKRATEENVRALVLDGYNGMPSFRMSLTESQVNDLMAYLVTLNSKAPATTGSGADAAFNTWCFTCHDPRKYGERGPDLRGLFTRGKFSGGEAVTERALRRLMDDGHGTAPPLRDWLDEPSRQAILNFLKTY
jgi:cytochrome c2